MTARSLPANQRMEDHADSEDSCSTASTRSQYTATRAEEDIDMSGDARGQVQHFQPTMAEGWGNMIIRSPSPPTDDEVGQEGASTSCSERSAEACWVRDRVSSCDMDLPVSEGKSVHAVSEGEEVLSVTPMDMDTTVRIYAIGYADDTYGVGGETGSLKRPLEATQKWIVDTGQGVNSKKSVAFSTEDPEGREDLKIGGDTIPRVEEFRCLGVGIRMSPSPDTGPLLAGRMKRAGELLSRLYGVQGDTYRKAEAAATLALSTGMYGVEVAMVREVDLMKLETAVLRAVWGTSRQSRAKEVLFAVLLKGHRVSPVMRAKYLTVA